jgi:hypothetical protein
MAAGVEQANGRLRSWLNVVANKEYIERLETVIKNLHRCSPTHLTSVYVKEEFEGKTVWEGDVEVFSLFGHPEAKWCYGWSYGEPGQFITMLELPPVTSPQSAVKIGIANQAKEAKHRSS